MKSRIHPNLSLSLSLLGFTSAGAFAQALAPEDFFHNGAVNYLSNNIPKALEAVTNGRAIFPNDIRLKKLEELLKQQNQQQSQQQNQQQDEQKQDSSKDQQKQDQQKQDSQQSKDQQNQQQEQSAQSEQKEGEQPEDQKAEEQQVKPGQLTPEEAKRMLDAQKGDERVLQFRPEGKPRDAHRPFKDW